ncbi:conserved hypothetical protein [Methylomarinovum caldicuralii]|uniref:Tetrahydromethanopterin synthesis protein n=1 Tax=Methylomarinovum caldicuralii TaxID=438856 RepID=A0AAU9CW53_9GAMM|nr:DUF447 domain-containing protein [Methylomarinovum caldicuralii]BCX82192.1 conserved hypothetical protein [Methylomarinovum caldicuralii]
MILETLVTTRDRAGNPHIAPMGVHTEGENLVILPFRPSRTLDNLLATEVAVVNASDDVRVFAGCLTGRHDWPLTRAERIDCPRLAECLSHIEVVLTQVEDDPVRPRLTCRPLHTAMHRPFRGFNRAQHAVLEAAILVSRLDRLPWDKIAAEWAVHKRALEKTAGPREREAWEWLEERLHQYRRERGL